jgi:hypothetical protein
MALELRPVEAPKSFFELSMPPSRRGLQSPARCYCGRFAKFIRYEANTMPHGEAVTTANCKRCGEVRIR